MLLSKLEEATKSNHLVHQLFSVKRCFGGHSSIGVVVGPGVETDRCSTIAELVQAGHVLSGLEWLDPFLVSVPRVSKIPCSVDVDISPPKYSDRPPCPWEVARAEQEAAKARTLHRRLGHKASLPCDYFLEKEMPYRYEKEKSKIFTEEGQECFLKIRDRAKRLLEKAGAFEMSKMFMVGDSWASLACVDRLVELGEIIEINKGPNVRGQDRVFVSSKR